MPSHHGIKVQIISKTDFGIFPEFPHPDSSQFTNRSPTQGNRSSSSISAASPSSGDSKADRLLGKDTAISVYIPSTSDTRWWIRYSILEGAPKTAPYFYFKLFINGREITAWGCLGKVDMTGQITRALFDPSSDYIYEDEKGKAFKRCGLERRAFYFMSHQNNSVAADGGLIEIRVYRSRGKQRRLQEPLVYKNQQEYGIALHSGGLLDKPQEAKFYDWHLKDPVDTPFTAFKFHYRSWNSLVAQNLVPESHPRRLLPLTPSLQDLYGLSLQTQEQVHEKHFEQYTDEDEILPAARINERLVGLSGKGLRKLSGENHVQGDDGDVSNSRYYRFQDSSPSVPSSADDGDGWVDSEDEEQREVTAQNSKRRLQKLEERPPTPYNGYDEPVAENQSRPSFKQHFRLFNDKDHGKKKTRSSCVFSSSDETAPKKPPPPASLNESPELYRNDIRVKNWLDGGDKSDQSLINKKAAISSMPQPGSTDSQRPLPKLPARKSSMKKPALFRSASEKTNANLVENKPSSGQSKDNTSPSLSGSLDEAAVLAVGRAKMFTVTSKTSPTNSQSLATATSPEQKSALTPTPPISRSNTTGIKKVSFETSPGSNIFSVVESPNITFRRPRRSPSNKTTSPDYKAYHYELGATLQSTAITNMHETEAELQAKREKAAENLITGFHSTVIGKNTNVVEISTPNAASSSVLSKTPNSMPKSRSKSGFSIFSLSRRSKKTAQTEGHICTPVVQKPTQKELASSAASLNSDKALTLPELYSNSASSRNCPTSQIESVGVSKNNLLEEIWPPRDPIPEEAHPSSNPTQEEIQTPRQHFSREIHPVGKSMQEIHPSHKIIQEEIYLTRTSLQEEIRHSNASAHGEASQKTGFDTFRPPPKPKGKRPSLNIKALKLETYVTLPQPPTFPAPIPIPEESVQGPSLARVEDVKSPPSPSISSVSLTESQWMSRTPIASSSGLDDATEQVEEELDLYDAD